VIDEFSSHDGKKKKEGTIDKKLKGRKNGEP
jgi:hypothetical protein